MRWKSEKIRANINNEEKWIFLEDNLPVICISLYVLFGSVGQLDVSVDITHSQLYQQMHLNVTERSGKSFCAANDVVCVVTLASDGDVSAPSGNQNLDKQIIARKTNQRTHHCHCHMRVQ